MPRSVIVVGIIILALFAAFEVYRFRLTDKVQAAQCRALYARARSAADTNRVDIQVASGATGNLRCGELRRSGRIR